MLLNKVSLLQHSAEAQRHPAKMALHQAGWLPVLPELHICLVSASSGLPCWVWLLWCTSASLAHSLFRHD